MKVAQIIPCLGKNSGGPTRSVYELSKGLRSIGVESEIVTNNYLINPNIVTDDWIRSVDVAKIRPFEYSSKYRDLIRNSVYDLFHIQSVYSYPVTFAARYARKHNIPYIIAPRGSLYKAALDSSSYWKKQLFNRLFLFKDLQNASVIHATCEEEMNQLRKLGINTPIAVIPNSISLPNEMPQISETSKFRLCFLGRINPIKNLDGLIKAWHAAGVAQREDCELVIIGGAVLDREKNYLDQLHKLEKELHITNISWKGSVVGKAKDDILNSCSFFILPSHSENFGMVVIESLMQGVPVIASKGTPWNSLVNSGCGWWIDNGVDEMKTQIIELLNVSETVRKEMGHKGQLFVKDNFSTVAVCNNLKCMYGWIINGGKKPSFVYA